MIKTKQAKQNGSALAYALVMLAVVLIILVSILQYVASQIRFGNYIESKEESFRIAESGLYEYRWYLAHETDGKPIQDIKNFWTSGNPRGLGDPYYGDYYNELGNKVGEYEVNVSLDNASNPSLITIISKGWTDKYPDSKRTIRAKLRRSIWSDYVVLTNEYSVFDSGWDINGKIMSNTGVHFDGVAHNVVYAGSSQYLDPVLGINKPGVWTACPTGTGCGGRTESQVFLAGKRFPVVKKDFAGVAVDLSAMKTVAFAAGANQCNADSCYFDNADEGRQIIFKTDGTFDVYTVNQVKTNSNSIKKRTFFGNFNTPNSGLVYVNGNVWVQGTVNDDRVTVVAAIIPNSGTNANIYIGAEQNLKYTNYDGADVIGLVAQGDVEVSDDSPSDFSIDAAILAQTGKVWKKDYNPHCCGGGCMFNKNSIRVFGSVVSNKKIDFTLAKVGCPHGFGNKDIDYDNNLLESPPPYFPSDVYYVVDFWEEL